MRKKVKASLIHNTLLIITFKKTANVTDIEIIKSKTKQMSVPTPIPFTITTSNNTKSEHYFLCNIMHIPQGDFSQVSDQGYNILIIL